MGHQPTDTWERGTAYEQYIGRWSRQIAPLFLAWLGGPLGLSWLDVGCGTGALSAAIVARCLPARVIGLEPSRGFLHTAHSQLAGPARLAQGAAAAIPLAAAAVDAVVSGLVLNFIPDPAAALAEMIRVTRGGGLVGAYVWDYADRMELIRLFWEVAAELDPAAAQLDEGPRFPLCHPDALAALFGQAGLRAIETTALDALAAFAHFADYWQPFLGGQGPAPAYVMALDSPARARLRERLQARIPTRPDGSIVLPLRAWAVRGRVDR